MSEIRGIGLDLCHIPRMRELIESGHSLRRMFTAEEQAYIRARGESAAQTMAGIFAAKEAILKALGTGMSIPMTDICIRHTPLGQPIAALTGKAEELGGTLLISITHEGDMAAANAIWFR